MAQPGAGQQEKVRIGGILCWRHLARFGVHDAPDRPGLAAEVFAALGAEGINVPFIVQCIDRQRCSQIVFCVASDAAAGALEVLHPLQARLGASGIVREPEVAVVAIYGPDFRERAGVAAEMFRALEAVGINILAISTSISTVSCLLRQEDARHAVAALEQTFTLP